MTSPPRLNRPTIVVIMLAAIALLVAVDARHHVASDGAPTAAAPAAGRLGALAQQSADISGLHEVTTGARGKIDVISAGGHELPGVGTSVHLPQPASVDVEGWAIDDATPGPLARMVAVVDGSHRLAVTYGRSRDDVANATNCPACQESGFLASIDKALLPPGAHQVRFLYVLPKANAYVASAPLTITTGSR